MEKKLKDDLSDKKLAPGTNTPLCPILLLVLQVSLHITIFYDPPPKERFTSSYPVSSCQFFLSFFPFF